jgi:hypothetical protein
MNSAIISYIHANYQTPLSFPQAHCVSESLRMRISSQQEELLEHITINDLWVGEHKPCRKFKTLKPWKFSIHAETQPWLSLSL